MRYPILLSDEIRLGSIAGVMKSGTTWLVNLLDDHPEIVARGEMHAFEVINGHPTLERVIGNKNGVRRWMLMTNNAWNRHYRDDPDEAIEELDADRFRFTYEWAIDRLLTEEKLHEPTQWVFEKSPIHTPEFYDRFNHYLEPYDRAIIHIVRDPRDVVISRWHHLRSLQRRDNSDFGRPLEDEADRKACFDLVKLEPEELSRKEHFFTYEGFLEQSLAEWTEVNEALAASAKRGLCPYLCVRYEDLRNDRNATLSRMFSFLGLDPEPEGMDDFGGSTDATGRKRTTMLRSGTGREWERVFTDEDHALVRSVCGPLMDVHGYD